MTTDLKLDDLRAFCAVVDHGSITAAAKHLRETKGAISRRISRLEEALDAKLLERQGRRAHPTDEGLVYRRKVGEALNVLAEASGELRQLQNEPRGHLRITTVPGFLAQPLAEAATAFREIYPGITVEVLFTNEILSFERHNIDLAIRGVTGRLADSSLIATPLAPFDPVLIAAPRYLERRGTPTRPAQLAEHTMVLAPISGFMRIVMHGEEDTVEIDVEPHIVSHDGNFLHACTLSGAGIGITIRDFAKVDIEAGRLTPILTDWSLEAPGQLYLIHSGRPVSPKVRLFKPFLLERLGG